MKKLYVRFCLSYRIFDISNYSTCVDFQSYNFSMFFWGWGIEEGVVDKLLLGLSTTPIRWVIVNNLLGDYFRIWNWPMRGSCLNSPFTALMMPMMAKTNRRSHAKPNAMPTMPASA